MHLEILWLEMGQTPVPRAFSAMSSDEDEG